MRSFVAYAIACMLIAPAAFARSGLYLSQCNDYSGVPGSLVCIDVSINTDGEKDLASLAFHLQHPTNLEPVRVERGAALFEEQRFHWVIDARGNLGAVITPPIALPISPMFVDGVVARACYRVRTEAANTCQEVKFLRNGSDIGNAEGFDTGRLTLIHGGVGVQGVDVDADGVLDRLDDCVLVSNGSMSMNDCLTQVSRKSITDVCDVDVAAVFRSYGEGEFKTDSGCVEKVTLDKMLRALTASTQQQQARSGPSVLACGPLATLL